MQIDSAEQGLNANRGKRKSCSSSKNRGEVTNQVKSFKNPSVAVTGENWRKLLQQYSVQHGDMTHKK